MSGSKIAFFYYYYLIFSDYYELKSSAIYIYILKIFRIKNITEHVSEFQLLTLARSRETQLPWSWPFAIWAISCMGPPLESMSHSLRSCSSRKKSNSLRGETGNHTDVAALTTIPDGSPGSSTLFRVMTRISSSPALEFSLFHLCTVDAHTPAQKLDVIRCANFSMLRRPLGVIAAKSNQTNHYYY